MTKKASILKNQIFIALLAAVALYLLTGIIRPAAINLTSIASIIAFTTVLGFVAAGQTLVIISGSDGIDLSVGATMSFTSILAAEIIRAETVNVPLALVACLAAGAVIGLINGFGVVKLGLPALVMTLTIGNIVTRIQLVMTNGTPYGTSSDAFTKTFTYRIFGFLPSIVFYGLLVFGIMFYILNLSKYGKRLYLVGNNKFAANLTGINASRTRIMAYVLAGTLSALAGFFACGYYHHVNCSMFDSYTMTSVSAVVIGGTMLAGGKGSYHGSIVGALLLTVLSNFLIVVKTSQAIRDIVMGLVLILLLTAYNRAKPIRQ